MALPRLSCRNSLTTARRAPTACCFAVYAPFGGDEVLSTLPEGSSQTLAQHPLVQGLMKVAAQGIHVAALIDRVADDTWLLEIEAGKPAEAKAQGDVALEAGHGGAGQPRGFPAPRAPEPAELGHRARAEGHGAGYLPEIDWRQLTLANLTGGKRPLRVAPERHHGRFAGAARWFAAAAGGSPCCRGLAPAAWRPDAAVHLGLGAALKAALDAGVPKLAVIHFDNRFNMSAEVLYTVAPYAEYATGYPN